jgi:hypothetical protein
MVKAVLDCIVAVLDAVSDGSDGEAACEAKGLLEKKSQFQAFSQALLRLFLFFEVICPVKF